MRRWFWILALGCSAFVFAALGLGVFVWAVWTRDLSLDTVFGPLAMLAYAAIAFRLCAARLDGPLPEVDEFDPSIFDQGENH